MKLIMKRSVVLAAILAAWSGAALGENVAKATRLSDAELDNITAGSAFVVVGIHNPGRAPENASGFNRNNHVFHCVNCVDVETLPITGGFLAVWKPGTSPETHMDPTIFRPIAKTRF